MSETRPYSRRALAALVKKVSALSSEILSLWPMMKQPQTTIGALILSFSEISTYLNEAPPNYSKADEVLQQVIKSIEQSKEEKLEKASQDILTAFNLELLLLSNGFQDPSTFLASERPKQPSLEPLNVSSSTVEHFKSEINALSKEIATVHENLILDVQAEVKNDLSNALTNLSRMPMNFLGNHAQLAELFENLKKADHEIMHAIDHSMTGSLRRKVYSFRAAIFHLYQQLPIAVRSQKEEIEEEKLSIFLTPPSENPIPLVQPRERSFSISLTAVGDVVNEIDRLRKELSALETESDGPLKIALSSLKNTLIVPITTIAQKPREYCYLFNALKCLQSADFKIVEDETLAKAAGLNPIKGKIRSLINRMPEELSLPVEVKYTVSDLETEQKAVSAAATAMNQLLATTSSSHADIINGLIRWANALVNFLRVRHAVNPISNRWTQLLSRLYTPVDPTLVIPEQTAILVTTVAELEKANGQLSKDLLDRLEKTANEFPSPNTTALKNSSEMKTFLGFLKSMQGRISPTPTSAPRLSVSALQ